MARTIAMPSTHELAVTRDGRTVFLGTRARLDSSEGITVVDAASRTVSRILRIGPCNGLHDMRLSRDDGMLWIACARDSTMLGVSTSDGRVLERWRTGTDGGWMLTSSPDDRKLYVANLEGRSVTIIDRRTSAVRTIPLGAGLLGAAVTPDGSEAWVSSADSNRIWIVDGRGDSVKTTFAAPGGTVRIRFTPDGRRAVLSNDVSRDVTVMDVATRRVLHRVELDSAPKVLALSADGRRAVVSQPAGRKIAVVDVERGALIGYVPVPGVPDGVTFTR